MALATPEVTSMGSGGMASSISLASSWCEANVSLQHMAKCLQLWLGEQVQQELTVLVHAVVLH